ncbi:MAG: TetR/AcrR family transcriptional regulator [Chloroflexi bacterium]|uniref:TetR/AcrR family transcriptional regulator n=1 Tax=Candidatus Chlorohelix allophototropha TaxID=3003348 RepID=A0A8T7LY65_9CHLR|nr:TetR/AcrR family transcriptional regulator [Chloroflexota bacterium]WJW66242.1 TetR/AcrR family transcriptional regulator [Chloroflexota bacterium L227-S17]
MARPDTNFEEKKAQLARMATTVFAKYGYEGTTNRLIAKEMEQQTGASFTPALIYHYYASKEDLFKAVVNQFPPPQKLSQVIQDNVDAPPEILLRNIGVTYLELFEDPITASLMRMLLTEVQTHPELARIVAERVVPSVVMPLAQYITEQVEQGKFKSANPVTLLFQFFSPLFQRVLLNSLGFFSVFPIQIPAREEYVNSLVDGYLHGVLVEQKGE